MQCLAMSDQNVSPWPGAAPVETRRLVLRGPTFDDVARIALYAGDVRVARMLVPVPHPYSPAHASAFVSDILASNGTGEALGLAIARRKEPDKLIGMTSFTLHGGAATIGWWLGPPYWGKGFATEAVAAVIAVAFRDPRVNVLKAGAFADNPASLRVHDKTGFVRTGLAERYSQGRGETVTQVEMALTRTAFEALSRDAAAAMEAG
jgi:ribosomal-protein-alanine N-acetyltransferase